MDNEIITDNSKTKNLVNGFLIYSIGSFGSKILAFLLVPLYTYYITTDQMGTYDLLNTTIGLLTPIITMQISDAAYRWMIRGNENQSLYVRAALQVLFINSAIASLIILTVNRYIAIPYCGYFILSLVTSRVLETIQRLLRGLRNQRLYAIAGVVYTFIYLVLNIIQICVLRMGVKSLFISMISANIITILLIFIKEKNIRVNLLMPPEIPLIKKLLSFSIPLVPNQLNWWVINSSNKYVVSYFLGVSANGICSIAYKLPSVLQIIFNLFNVSWQDVSIADQEKENGPYYTKVFQRLYMLYFSILWALAPITKVFVVLAMSDAYKSASKYVPILYLSTVFQAFSSFYGVGYIRSKETKKAASTSIYGSIVNLLVSLLLINFIGLYASALSSLVGFFVMWLMRVKQNSKELGIKIDLKCFLPLCISALLICTLTSFSSFNVDVYLSLLGIIAFLIFNKSYLFMVYNKIRKKVK